MSHDKLCSLSYIWKFKVVLFHLLLRISGTSCCNLFVFEEWDNGRKKKLGNDKKKKRTKKLVQSEYQLIIFWNQQNTSVDVMWLTEDHSRLGPTSINNLWSCSKAQWGCKCRIFLATDLKIRKSFRMATTELETWRVLSQWASPPRSHDSSVLLLPIAW